MGGVRVNGLLCVERCVDESALEKSVCVCVCSSEKCPREVAFAASESCKAPTRPPSAKVWVPAMM